MTTKELSIIGKKLAHLLPDYALKGSLLFKTTPQSLLLGLDFAGSSRDSRIFRVNAFFLPMFVLTDVIHFNYGMRVSPASDQWNADDPNLIDSLSKSVHAEALPFLNSISTLPGALYYLKTLAESSNQRINPHTLEALACTLIKTGEYSAALNVLAGQKKELESSTIPWMVELKNRAELLEGKLQQNHELALAQLEAWKSETSRNLKLDAT